MRQKHDKSANKSFILRFWQEEVTAAKGDYAGWRASLESIHDQDKNRYLSDASKLLELLESSGVEGPSKQKELAQKSRYKESVDQLDIVCVELDSKSSK